METTNSVLLNGFNKFHGTARPNEWQTQNPSRRGGTLGEPKGGEGIRHSEREADGWKSGFNPHVSDSEQHKRHTDASKHDHNVSDSGPPNRDTSAHKHDHNVSDSGPPGRGDKRLQRGNDGVSERDLKFDRHDFSRKRMHENDFHGIDRHRRFERADFDRGDYEVQSISVTKTTVSHTALFNGKKFDDLDKLNEAFTNLMDSAKNYIDKPNEKNYKALNESMLKLLDTGFAPSKLGGYASVTVVGSNGTTKAKLTMEITPAPTKSLEEARKDLVKTYSSRLDGTADIGQKRDDAYTNYIRALSEKFKREGKIDHTNNTPTTPVIKTSIMYVEKITQVSIVSLKRIKPPNFNNNLRLHSNRFDGARVFGNYHDLRRKYGDARHDHRHDNVLRHRDKTDGKYDHRRDNDMRRGDKADGRHGHRHGNDMRRGDKADGRHEHGKAGSANGHDGRRGSASASHSSAGGAPATATTTATATASKAS